MNELEQYLSEFGLYADVWTDDEGLHVHDWDTDECSVFAHDVDFEEVREHIVASRHALVLDVLFNNHRYYIKSRRSSGSFALVSVEGLKDENRSYKKLTLLAHTNAYLTNHYINLKSDDNKNITNTY